jgi:hypothetical protein
MANRKVKMEYTKFVYLVLLLHHIQPVDTDLRPA